MKIIKSNLPIYILSAALVFVGLAISTNNAGAANSNAAVDRLQADLNNFKRCVNQNFMNISIYDASRNPRMGIVLTCR